MDHKGHVVVVGDRLLQGLHPQQIKSFLFGSLGARAWHRALPAARQAERKPPRLRGARGLRHPAPGRPGPGAALTPARCHSRAAAGPACPCPAPHQRLYSNATRAGRVRGRRGKGLDTADLAAGANPNPTAGGGFPEGTQRSYLSSSTPTSPVASRAHPRLAAPPLRKSQLQQLAPAGFAATFTPSGAPGQNASLPLPLFFQPHSAKRKQDVPHRRQLRWEPSGCKRLSRTRTDDGSDWRVPPTALDSQWSPHYVTS